MKNTRAVLCALCASLSLGANAAVIDTTAPFTGIWSAFGESNTATYGQTFTITGDRVLDSFSLFLAGVPADPIDFKGYVYEWDGMRATGSELYSSGLRTFNGSPTSTPSEFSFSTGGVELTVGKTYVAFLSASGFFDGQEGVVGMPYSGSFGTDALSGGNFVFQNNGNDFSSLTRNSWANAPGDVWFKASFSNGSPAQVPEPATLALLGAGLVGLSFSRRNVEA